MLHLFNTLTRSKEQFKPLKNKQVGMYTCGPTVYNYAHIGNLRTYVFEDILKRILMYNNYKVKHVMNITDVGHLTSDADEGEDKMEKGARREGKTAWEIAEFYAKTFQENIKDLNILPPDIWCRATDHIREQIKLVKILTDKGYTYETSDGIYFDTAKLPDYGKLAGLKKQQLKAGARIGMGEKKNPHDFALWKWSERHPERSEGSPVKRQMEWLAFGRLGFPGWHLECSAMALKYLGEQFDIHCGGIDHIPVHHTNEIAQSETSTGKKPWVKYWLHGEFLVIDEGKMAKSESNFITLQTLKTKNINPLAYRYFLLQTHYRSPLNFTWQALEAAEKGLRHLYEEAKKQKSKKTKKHIDTKNLRKKFLSAINDDLNLPQALSIVWNALKKQQIDYKTLLKFDEVLGLELKKAKKQENKKTIVPDEVKKLLELRKKARQEKNWAESDKLREKIKKFGFTVEDTEEGQKIKKTNHHIFH